MTPEAEAMGMVVRRRHRSIRDDGLAVEVDPRLPWDTHGRTVYHSDQAARYLAAPHRHQLSHELMCLAGECRIGTQPRAGGPVVWQTIRQGDRCRIEGGVAHRVWFGKAAILAVRAPATSWLAVDPVEWLGVDDFWEVPCDS